MQILHQVYENYDQNSAVFSYLLYKTYYRITRVYTESENRIYTADDASDLIQSHITSFAAARTTADCSEKNVVNI